MVSRNILLGVVARGKGSYWTTLMANPSTGLEANNLVYIPGMNMSQATVVASVQL